jgi:hypothetical protein
MGFNTTATTVTLTAKLTPIGRQKMVSTNNSLISTFSLGDSDANYNTALTLASGQIPNEGGSLGANSTMNNSTTQNVKLRSQLIVNGSGKLYKSVESQSITINSETISNGQTFVSGTSFTHFLVNRNDVDSDNKVNYFYSFGLPLNSNDDYKFTGTTYSKGGFSDTALSGIAQNTILIISLNQETFGETLDGKVINLTLPSLGPTYNIYSTFQNSGIASKTQDANIRDNSVVADTFGTNIAFLFSDNIMTPNGGSGSLSWATGFGTNKPFSVNNKQLYNLQTNSNRGLTADTVVGIAYLDKGILVITHPTIVADYNSVLADNAVTTINSISTNVYQSITCIAARGEFAVSTNSTFTASDTPRISEVGLFDNVGNLIAIAKTDRHVTKNINEFLAMNIKINL